MTFDEALKKQKEQKVDWNEVNKAMAANNLPPVGPDAKTTNLTSKVGGQK